LPLAASSAITLLQGSVMNMTPSATMGVASSPRTE